MPRMPMISSRRKSLTRRKSAPQGSKCVRPLFSKLAQITTLTWDGSLGQPCVHILRKHLATTCTLVFEDKEETAAGDDIAEESLDFDYSTFFVPARQKFLEPPLDTPYRSHMG